MFLFTTSPAFAHKLIVDARVKGDRIRVEAFYDDDTPAQKAKVIVENEEKKVVAEGRTDDRGLWSCPLPVPGIYVVRAESVGHAAKETLVVAEPSTKPSPPPSGDFEQLPMPRTVLQNESTSFGKLEASDSELDDETRRTRKSREEKTATPWLNIVIGFAIIAVLCISALAMRKRGQPSRD